MRRDLTIVAVIWALATLASVALVAVALDPFPTRGAEEAELIDDAFFALTYMATPVFGHCDRSARLQPLPLPLAR